jgi:MFS family permease
MKTLKIKIDSRKIPLAALFTANAISMTGNMIAVVVIPWFVLKTTGSAEQMGITGFFSVLPVVLAGFFGGTLVDRLGYKHSSVLADLTSGVMVVLIPILYATVGLPFWVLMVLVFLGALLDAPGDTARTALIPDLAEQAEIPLERATAINQMVERGSRLVGAPLGGLLIGFLGQANALWVDGISFLISALLVAFLVKGKVKTKVAETSRGNYWKEMSEGFRFLAGDRLLLTIALVIMVTNFLDAGFSGVVLPVYMNQVYGNALSLGLIIAMGGGGAVLGALLYGWLGVKLPRFITFVSMFILVSLRFFVLLFNPPLWVLLVSTFLLAIGAGPLNPIINAVEYERIPADMRGRVFGIVTAGAWIAMPLSELAAGFLVNWLGTMPVILGCGVTYVAATVSMLAIPSMRAMDRLEVAAGDWGGMK